MGSVKMRRTAKTGYIVMSLAFGIFGVLLMVMPDISVMVIARLLGILLILFGTVKLVGYFSKDLYRLTYQYDLAMGILLLVLGSMVFARSDHILVFISLVHGLYALADSLFKLQTALDARRFGLQQWWLITAAAVFTGTIGFLLVLRPFESAGVLVRLAGVSLLTEGILNLVTVLSTGKILRSRKPDIIEGRFEEL